MKRSYYVHYYRDFGNTYRLYWSPEGEAVPDCWERITRKGAEALCRRERYAKRTDPAFSGYADEYIFPASSAGPECFGRYGLIMDGPYIVTEEKADYD